LRSDPSRLRAHARSSWLRSRIRQMERGKPDEGQTHRGGSPVQRTPKAAHQRAEVLAEILAELLNRVLDLHPQDVVRVGIDKDLLNRCVEALDLRP